MSRIRDAALLMVSLAITSCATPHLPAWPNGVSEGDARAINRLIRTQTSGSIVAYAREDDGSLRLKMSGPAQHTFVVRRINGKWSIVKEYVIVS